MEIWSPKYTLGKTRLETAKELKTVLFFSSFVAERGGKRRRREPITVIDPFYYLQSDQDEGKAAGIRGEGGGNFTFEGDTRMTSS